MISFKGLLGASLLILGLVSAATAKTCRATYGAWMDWTIHPVFLFFYFERIMKYETLGS